MAATTPVAVCRSMRRWSVRKPRRARKQSSGPGTPPIAFCRKRSRSAMASSLVTTMPPSVSECPARYFVDEWNVMSAPSSSGRCKAGARTCCPPRSAAHRRPRTPRTTPRPRDVDDLEQRVGGRLEPDDARPLVERLVELVRPGREVDVARFDTLRAVNAFEVAIRAAVDVVANDHLVAGGGQLRERGSRRRTRGECDPVAASFQRGHRPFEPLPGGVLRAGVS